MRRIRKELPETRLSQIRGGKGSALRRDYLGPGEMAGVEFVSLLTLEPGASIGDHPHQKEEELYLVLEGEGLGRLDGESFPVGPGDAYLCKASHSHGLVNLGPKALRFLAVLAKVR